MTCLPREFLLNGGTLEQLTEKYAIKAKRHGAYPNLVQLKYNQIDSPITEPLVQQCRGVILDQDDSWRIVARPFDKFFNYGEASAASIDWSTARVQEKLDGSLMIVYWYDGAWHVATSGTPDASGDVNGAAETFKDLFWRVWAAKQYLTFEHTTKTYMFELMTRHNRVVVRHLEDRLALIGIRDAVSGQEDAPVAVQNWETVRSFPLQSFTDIEATFATLNPLEQEGYVVVDAAFNRVKVKHPGYVAVHHMKDGFGPKRVLDVVRKGETSELLTHFPEWQSDFDRVSKAFGKLVTDLETAYAAHNDIPLQKDFALAVKGSPCSGALFALRAGKVKSVREFLANMHLDNLSSLLGFRDAA